MKLVMPSRGNLARFRSNRLLFDASDLIIVCHTNEQRDRILSRGRWDVRVHGIPEGVEAIGQIRDWVEKFVVPKGEWYAGMDDNIETIYRVSDAFYDEDVVPENYRTREIYRAHQVSNENLWKILTELKLRCEDQKTILGGFGWIENPGFRPRKWQAHGYVKTKLFVKKNVGLRWKWDDRLLVMTDHAQSYKVIAEYGSVAVNHFVYAQHPQYEVGGIGSHAERLPFRKPTLKFIYEHFKDLVGPHDGVLDKPWIRLRGQKSIDRWRKENGYLA